MKDRWRDQWRVDEGSMKDRWIKSKKQTKKENKNPKEATLYKNYAHTQFFAPPCPNTCTCTRAHAHFRRTTKKETTKKQRTTKKENEKNPKKEPYIKNYATPDRPPPAAVMLVSSPWKVLEGPGGGDNPVSWESSGKASRIFKFLMIISFHV